MALAADLTACSHFGDHRVRTWLLFMAGIGFFVLWTFLLISGVTASWRTGWPSLPAAVALSAISSRC